MNQTVNRRIVLASRPVGEPTSENFRLEETAVPQPSEGQVLVRNLYLSLDPYMRGRMSEGPSYAQPVAIDAVMGGGTVGRVVDSRDPAFSEGDLVLGFGNWQDYALARGAELTRLPSGMARPSWALGVLGMPGFTAWYGLMKIGAPKEGETVVVAAASGAVGSVVGQIAKLKGCRAVGIAGGPDKCRHIVEDLGFDAAVDYKRPDWREQLAAATPDGIDVNFENVGGEIMEAVMARMNLFSRMPLCGMISGYNTGDPAMRGDFSPILMRRIEVRGFIVIDFMPKFAEGAMQLAQWVVEGKLKHRETIVDGLENAPVAVNRLFDGGNIGKLVVKVSGTV